MKYGTIIGTLVIGIALGAVGVLAVYHPHPEQNSPQNSNDTGPVIDRLRAGSSMPLKKDVARYTNPNYGFSVDYPMELVQKEFNEGGGALTVVFQKPNEEKGFQIFITPYDKQTIGQDELKKDLNGAPMKNVQQIVLPGGINAVHFESQAPIIGDSTEVWFIHGGYLFEITSYHTLDSWLAEITSTLRFTK